MIKSKYNFDLCHNNKYYLYNPYSGLLRLNEESYNQYVSNITDSAFEKQLVNKYFFVDNELDEYKRICFMRKRIQYNYDTLILELVPTLNCNCSCEYCFVKKEKCLMSKEIEYAIVSFINSKIQNGIKNVKVTWFGGEPLLAFSSIENLSRAIIDLCRKNNVKYQAFLVTNGILLEEKIVSKFTALKINGLQITLDGSEEQHNVLRPCHSENGYKRIIKNLHYFKNGLKPTIRINVSKKNSGNIKSLIKQLKLYSNNINYISLAPVFSLNSTPFSYNDFLLNGREYADIETDILEYLVNSNLRTDWQLKGEYIGDSSVLINSYCIAPTGDMYKSHLMIGEKKAFIGNIVDYSMVNCSFDSNYINYMESENFDKECETCFYLPFCLGGERKHLLNKCDSIKYNFVDRLKIYIDNLERKNNEGTLEESR